MPKFSSRKKVKTFGGITLAKRSAKGKIYYPKYNPIGRTFIKYGLKAAGLAGRMYGNRSLEALWPVYKATHRQKYRSHVLASNRGPYVGNQTGSNRGPILGSNPSRTGKTYVTGWKSRSAYHRMNRHGHVFRRRF